MPASFSTSRTGSRWRERAFDFIAADDDARRPARPFVSAHGKLLFPGLASDYRRHDPRRAGALRSDRRRAIISTARSPGSARFDAHYADADTGGYYLSADDADDLLLRPHSTADDATPNSNAVAARQSGAARRARRRRRMARAEPTG